VSQPNIFWKYCNWTLHVLF